jgi:hypothetical protein
MQYVAICLCLMLTLVLGAGEPPAAMVPASLMVSAPSDFQISGYHTKSWKADGKTFLGTQGKQSSAALWRTTSAHVDVGTIGWRRLFVAERDGIYTFSISLKNGQSWLHINRGQPKPWLLPLTNFSDSIKKEEISIPCRQGDRLEVDYAASFGAGYWAGAQLQFGFKPSYLPPPKPTGDVATVAERLRLQLLAMPLASAVALKGWVEALGANGRWPDIVYPVPPSASAALAPATHQQRTRELAIAYERGLDIGLPRAHVLNAIGRAVRDNVVGRSLPTTFVWGDWYNVYIECPWRLLETLLLVADELPPEIGSAAIAYLRDELTMKSIYPARTYQFEGGGQNVVWVAGNTVRLGVLRNDAGMVAKGFTAMAQTTRIVDNQPGRQEGFMADGSFHQHDWQLYNGGYGLWYVDSMLRAMELARATGFAVAFDRSIVTALSDNILRGHRWMQFKGTMDFGVRGRNIARPGQEGGVSTAVLGRLSQLDPAQASAYGAWQSHIAGTAASPVIGNSHFWQSDFMVQRGADWYLSAKVISQRTTGTETMNGENLKGRNLPLGATNIMTHGGEYQEIYPVWDWSRIPGTTTVKGKELGVVGTDKFTGTNAFGGGVSDGTVGLLAFRSDYDGIQAAKVYVFLPNRLVCLGAGIQGPAAGTVVTTINQCRAKGQAVLGFGPGVQTQNPANGSRLANWVWHDDVGYIFPTMRSVQVLRQVQTGTWKGINAGGSPDQQSREVFGLHLDHGTKPSNASYVYTVVPRIALDRMPTVAADVASQNIRNDTTVQSLISGTRLAAVFHQPTTITLPSSRRIGVSQPTLLLAEEQPDGAVILQVADPLATATTLRVTIDGKPIDIPVGSGLNRGRTVPYRAGPAAPSSRN